GPATAPTPAAPAQVPTSRLPPAGPPPSDRAGHLRRPVRYDRASCPLAPDVVSAQPLSREHRPPLFLPRRWGFSASPLLTSWVTWHQGYCPAHHILRRDRSRADAASMPLRGSVAPPAAKPALPGSRNAFAGRARRR